MFCPMCGEKLVEQLKQRFCMKCGFKILSPEELSKLKTKGGQYVAPGKSQLKAEYPDFTDYRQKPKYDNRPGKYSKRSLGFGISSLVVLVVALIVGFGIRLMSSIFMMYPYSSYYSYFSYSTLISSIVVSIMHIAGLAFGVASRLNSTRAKDSEPINPVEKIGSVFGIIGIVGNLLATVLALVYLGMSTVTF